jgi:hypothetical protein
MSVVTGIMLILGAGDWGAEPLREVQEWIGDCDFYTPTNMGKSRSWWFAGSAGASSSRFQRLCR